MELQMKKCKECGKLFTPTNPRQKYCTDQHYGPCPVCKKLVPLKWNGYPASRCEECKAAGLRAVSNPKQAQSISKATDDLNELPVDFVERLYVGKSNFNFISNHRYLIKARANRPYGFIIEAIRDMTDNEDVDDAEMPISSISSFNYFFKEVSA